MSKARILKSVFLITAAYFFSLVINVAVQVVLAGRFGVGIEMDSYLVAFTIPSFFILIFGTSLSKVFTPVFIDHQVKKGEQYVWGFASNFLNTSSLALLALLFVAEVSVRQCVLWLAPGLGEASRELTVSLMRIFLPVIFFGGVSTILTSVYYAHNRFVMPSLGLILNSFVMFLALILFKERLGIFSIAWGALLGAVVQCVFLAPILVRRYTFCIRPSEEGLRRLYALLLPVLIGAFFYKAIGLIEKNIASGLSAGSISYLGYASRIIPVLLVLTSSGISTTLFPLLSKYASLGDWASVKKTFLSGINSLAILVSPVVACLIVLRGEVIRLLYERGNFTAADTHVTASLFVCYLIALFFMVVSTVPSQIYTVTQSTRVLIPIGILETGAYVAYCFGLSRLFGLRGIAYAFALYYLTAFVINYVVLYIRIKAVSVREMLLAPLKIVFTALLAGCALHYLNAVLRPYSKPVPEVLFVGAIVLVSLVLYVFILHFLRVAEVGEVKRIIFAKFRGDASVASPVIAES